MTTNRKIQAILSDFDGTLITLANAKTVRTNSIPLGLEQILNKISTEIPVGIISTKDFEFLNEKTVFAHTISCMMGVETVLFDGHKVSRHVERRSLYPDLQTLQMRSEPLEEIAKEITSDKEFSDLLVERKHTTDGILAGLTVDWRHHRTNNWPNYRKSIHYILDRMTMIANLKKKPSLPGSLYVQKYDTHPFVDIYSIECNKGMAFDTAISEFENIPVDSVGILYLGDSENDNPAFRKAGVSIGIRSDWRLTPKLDCNYTLDYEKLASFLIKLRDNDYLFSEELLQEEKKEELKNKT